MEHYVVWNGKVMKGVYDTEDKAVARAKRLHKQNSGKTTVIRWVGARYTVVFQLSGEE